MPFDAESEDDLFGLIVSENPQLPDKATMAELSTDAIELFLHVGVKYMNQFSRQRKVSGYGQIKFDLVKCKFNI